MEGAYTAVTQLFYQLSLLFFWPVALSLLVLFAISIMDLGGLFFEMWRRRREPRTDLAAAARSFSAELAGTSQPAGAEEHHSPVLARFRDRVRHQLNESGSPEHLDVWLEEALQNEEIRVTSRLDRTRAFIRIGPMLGLAGTIIPLGPALRSLLEGDMANMVNHLVIGFGAVVCGLVLSGIAYFITLVRERWTRVELKDLENFCELLLRTRKSAEADREYQYATLSEA
jgi:biopolymer transport protein ExbB/TolQ